ncbi:MAG: hypothetical protein RMM98_00605 [Acidobacteriota bacterium]|nr:hypothetical protein [Blastocatellia bacterium]MDW8238089.1 hypothetical protein [Acidobacteriota bacterium]
MIGRDFGRRLGFCLICAVIGVAIIASLLVGSAGSWPQAAPTEQRVFVGINQQGDFQKALNDALAKAQDAAGCCDHLVTYRVTDIQGQVGGIAGRNQITVTISASW